MINYISKPFRWFFKLEAASGLVLLFAAIIALVISNSGLAELYFTTLNKYLFIGVNDFGLKLSVLHWINDALMAIFFFFFSMRNCHGQQNTSNSSMYTRVMRKIPKGKSNNQIREEFFNIKFVN